MPTSNTEELGHFLKCTVIGRGVFGPCACCVELHVTNVYLELYLEQSRFCIISE